MSTSPWFMSSSVPERRGSLMSCILQACSRLWRSLFFCSSLVSIAVTSFCSCVSSLSDITSNPAQKHFPLPENKYNCTWGCQDWLVGTAQLFADFLHLVILVVDFGFLGEVLVLQVLQLGHCLVDDLHVSVLLLQKNGCGEVAISFKDYQY